MDTLLPLTLLVLRVRDMDRSREFYARLGFVFEEHRHNDGPLHFAGEGHGYTLELYAGRPDFSGTDWLVRIGFEVRSLEALLLTLPEDCVLVPPRDSPWGRRTILVDPDHNRIELTERAND